MKIKKSFFSLFLLQVILLTSAKNAFAFTKITPGFDLRQGAYLKKEQDTKSVIFEETVAEISYRSSQENENDFFPQYLDLGFNEFETQVYFEEKVASNFQPNKRTLLRTQIFPFHFFW